MLLASPPIELKRRLARYCLPLMACFVDGIGELSGGTKMTCPFLIALELPWWSGEPCSDFERFGKCMLLRLLTDVLAFLTPIALLACWPLLRKWCPSSWNLGEFLVMSGC